MLEILEAILVPMRLIAAVLFLISAVAFTIEALLCIKKSVFRAELKVALAMLSLILVNIFMTKAGF